MPASKKAKTVVKTVRLDKKLNDQVVSYSSVTGQTEANGIRSLIKAGLMAQGLELYSTPLAMLLREILQGQLDLFREELDERNEELEERVAKICSRGTKAALQSAIMSVDLMRGLFPAMAENSEEEIWKAYQKQAGELQSGAAFHDVKAHNA